MCLRIKMDPKVINKQACILNILVIRDEKLQ